MKDLEKSTAFHNINKETHSHTHSISKDGEPLDWFPISTEEELHLAAQNGGSYYLAVDINLTKELEITKDMNLCLNDKVLKQTAADARVISIAEGTIFHLCDCSGDKGTTRYLDHDSDDSWVLRTDDSTSEYKIVGGVVTGSELGGVRNHGEFIMNSGSITGNHAWSGGGVLNRRNATFALNGGSITMNSAYDGGGVKNYGAFTMHGGSITGNCAYFGGGVDSERNALFIMHGGTITGNSAKFGGGVFHYNTFIMRGGNITGNTAKLRSGGVYNNYGVFMRYGGVIDGNSSDYAENNLASWYGKYYDYRR